MLSIAYPLAPVGPDEVGGAEQVLTRIDAALDAAGHRSIVVASEESAVAGILVATPKVSGRLDDAARRAACAAHRQAIGSALRQWPVDLVHMHGIDFHRYLPAPGPPVLATLHLPLAWYPDEAVRPSRPRTYLHCVSAAQRRADRRGLDLLADIPNGVATEAFAAPHARRGFALALGRICPEKGFHVAIEAARRASVSLLLAGTVYRYPEHERYFDEEIVPRLDQRRRYIGPLGLVRKRRFLSAASCLLVPSSCAETGSLVAMEALACGTPVIAFPNGALADVVEHGRIGFLVRDEQEMAEAIARAPTLDRHACRAAARTRFSAAAMVDRYLALYHRLARSPELAAAE